MATDPQFVAALSHGIEILRCFSPDQPILTNSALARMAGMPRSSVSRLTYTLVKLGYLDYETDSGAYRLGLCVLPLQPAALAGMRIDEHIAPYVTELANQLDARVLLTTYENYSLTIVHGACPSPDIPTASLVGCEHPIPRRATGRACLAVSNSNEREKLLAHLAHGDEGRSAALHEESDRAVTSYRSEGYCTSLGEVRPGNNSISVMLNVPHLGRRMFLACGGPEHRIPESVLRGRVATSLMQTVANIERASARLSSRIDARASR
ncbi:IclR family transcriptional regulator [Caballeronia calidae]|nr:helix-turn-helix domain-containing protein [Caballeronia calidae]